ncbi:MAG: hypothetical protein V1738_03380 [Patescibacteria group bacterium]
MNNLHRETEAFIKREQTNMLMSAKSLLRLVKPETWQSLAEPLDLNNEYDVRILNDFHRLLGEATAALRLVAAIGRVSLVVQTLLAQRHRGQLTAEINNDQLVVSATGKSITSEYIAQQIAERSRISIEAAHNVWRIIAHQLQYGTLDLPNVKRLKVADGKIALTV